MDAAYLEAAVPRPYRILGKKLQPFCIGHEILFQRFQNKFSIESKEEPGIEDLLTGVFICSRPYTKDASLDGFSIPIGARILTKIFGTKYVARAFYLFSAYIASHSQIPDYYSKDSGPRDNVGTPTIQAVKVSLMSNLGLSEDDALNTPFSLAFWNHLSWAEAQGGIQIIDDAERERLKQAADNNARIDEMWRKRQAENA